MNRIPAICYISLLKKETFISDTPSLQNKIYSYLPTNVASNSAIFIGSGILASSYSTIWMNDPTTQSGIALAGLFNGIALGITNRIAKTDEKTSYVFNTVLTVVTLAATILTAPYLAAALTEKYAVVLTTDVAFQNGMLYLGIKAILSLLFICGSKIFAKEQLTLDKIKNLSNEQLEAEYKYFNTNGNEKAWSDLSEEVQQAFIQAVLNLEAVKSMQFPTQPDDIKVVMKYNKFQASLLRALLVSRGPQVLDVQMSSCYAQIFFSHDIKPLDRLPIDQKGYKILPKDFKILDLNEIKSLTRNKLEWYQLFTITLDVWKSFPLDVQNAYNVKCREYGMDEWFLSPKDKQSIENANDLVIMILESQLKRPNAVVLSAELKNLVQTRYNAIFDALPPIQNMQDVEKLTGDQVEKYHCWYSLHPTSVPGEDLQKALSNRFITQKLNPPTDYWECNGEIPAQDAYAKLDKLQLRWLFQFFATSLGSWNSLDFRSQVTYNNRFLKEIGPWLTVTAKPDIAVIQEEGAISSELAKLMQHAYRTNQSSIWDQMPPEACAAFKALFEKANPPPK